MLTFATMYRKIWIFAVALLLLVSCGNKKKQIEPAVVVSDTVDTIPIIQEEEEDMEDTAFLADPEEPALPSTGNESFDDFIYVFAGDTAFQLSRIKFPLPYYEGDKPLRIEKKDWTHDELFVKQSYYTLLIDKEEDVDWEYSDSLTSVQVEWIYLKTGLVKKYYFERVGGKWMLEALNFRPIFKPKRAEFVEFFTRFVADSLYQVQHIRQPLEFITTDPDDDFSILETTLDTEQWFAFKPILPDERLSNIIHGQEIPDNSPYKILQLKGIGNGFLNTLFFRRKGNGQWELYKFEDTSN